MRILLVSFVFISVCFFAFCYTDRVITPPATLAGDTVPSIYLGNNSVRCEIFYLKELNALVGLSGGFVKLNAIPENPVFHVLATHQVRNSSKNVTIYTVEFNGKTYFYHSQSGLIHSD